MGIDRDPYMNSPKYAKTKQWGSIGIQGIHGNPWELVAVNMNPLGGRVPMEDTGSATAR